MPGDMGYGDMGGYDDMGGMMPGDMRDMARWA